MFGLKKNVMPTKETALEDHDDPIIINDRHAVLNASVVADVPDGFEQAMFGLGCFWGAERMFWTLAGVYSTAVGYSAGFTKNARYEEVCTGRTGHNEVVKIIFDPSEISYQDLLTAFWESHNPTQGMRQGNDAGTQYRSGIYFYTEEQAQQADASRISYQAALNSNGFDEITTEIRPVQPFYYAEAYHQQYLAKNPQGYCGLGGVGVSCAGTDH